MNKKIYFNIDINKDINILEKELSDYNKLKIKFFINKNNYNKEEQETFLNNFYNAKLNTIISILYYYSNKNELNNKNNPFFYIDNNREIKKYSLKICQMLLNINDENLARREELIDTYENLTKIIEINKNNYNTFIKNNVFWNEFINFYKELNIDMKN